MRRALLFAALMLATTVTPARAGHPEAFAVYAHRGGASIAPENTLGAFRQAHARWGARGIWLEMDTQLTKDNQLVIIHDDSLDRTVTGPTKQCTGKVNTHTLEEIQNYCDARKGFPVWPSLEDVPSAEQVFTEGRAAGWRIMIEIKNIPGEANFDATGRPTANALVELIERTGMEDRVIVQSFWPPALDAVELLDEEIHTALLTTATLPGAPNGVGFTAVENAAYAGARGYEISAPDEASPDITAETVAAMHSLGKAVVPWTIDARARIDELLAAGVDGIISNDPGLVYEAIDGG